MDTLPLEKLVDEAKAGNVEAYRALYERVNDQVFLFVRTRSASRDDALDITQEVFIDLWKGLRKFRYENDAKFWSFLYTLARRKAARFYRFRRITISLEDLEDVAQEEFPPQEKLFFENALAKLRGRDREVVLLHYRAGLPFRDIASILGASEESVKVRHHRVIRKLQTYYENR
jgi:RNA polymerase sigma-70 factor, ECF subfamily